jgi:hypothetical protein
LSFSGGCVEIVLNASPRGMSSIEGFEHYDSTPGNIADDPGNDIALQEKKKRGIIFLGLADVRYSPGGRRDSTS